MSMRSSFRFSASVAVDSTQAGPGRLIQRSSVARLHEPVGHVLGAPAEFEASYH